MTRLASSASRRAFLLKISAGAVSLTGLPYAPRARATDDTVSRSGRQGSAERKERRPSMLEEFTAQDFASRVGSTFQVELADGRTASLELIEARTLDAHGDRPPVLHPRQPFSIVFRAPASLAWQQGIYRLGHAQLGKMEIFLVPIGPSSGEVRSGEARLEAIFG